MSDPADQIIEQALVDAARVDPVAFVDYVLRDEGAGGGPIVSCKMHEEWHAKVTKHRRLQILSHVDSGKTMTLAVGRVLFELGKNPDLRVLIVANTSDQASRLCSLIGRYIEHSAELHRVFPHLQKDPNGVWNATALSVKRSGPSKDASVRGCGVHGNVLGSRVDLAVVDDICDFENTCTPRLRDDLDRWIRSTILGRLTATSRVVILGNVWGRDDQHARFEGSGWPTFRYPVTGGLLGRSRWPERWPASRIADVRKTMGPREAARQLDCIPPDDAAGVFEAEWIVHALDAGEGASTEIYASAVEPGSTIVLGVDTATSQSRTADESALVLCRAARSTGRREVTQVVAGRWTFDDLADKIVNVAKIHRAIPAIETNGGGEYIAQAVEKALPILRLNTSQSSKKMRVEMLISELSGGRWSFRQSGPLDPQMKRLAQEILSFSFTEHCGDRMAGLLVAVEAIRTREHRPKGRVINNFDMFSR